MGLARIKRKIDIQIRKMREVETKTLSPAEAKQLRFYQFKKSTAAFFYTRTGKTDIRVEDTPHYALAKALASKDAQAISAATEYYRSYLTASWNTTDTERLTTRVAAFTAHFNHFQSNPNKAPAVVLSQLETGGDFFSVDGNHRGAFAAALDRPLLAEIWPIDLAFLKFSDIRRFYGTGFMNRPYQSIFLHGKVVIPGRRDDALERLGLIPDHVLRGSRVLDVASNFGMSSLLSKRVGAASALGLEISPEMVDFASRFAMFDNAHPDVQYRTFNVDEDQLPVDEKFDVAFMFSIYDHLKKPERLLEIAKNHVTKYVVFEAHPKAPRENYTSFFDSGLFSSITTLGTLSQSVTEPSRNRILWLCEKKQD